MSETKNARLDCHVPDCTEHGHPCDGMCGEAVCYDHAKGLPGRDPSYLCERCKKEIERKQATESRLTDAQALRALNPRTRQMIKTRGFVRCLNHPNLWHNPVADRKGCALACILAKSTEGKP